MPSDAPPRRKREARYDRHGRIICMVAVDGYRMVRRPRCPPFVLSEREWAALDTAPWTAERVAAFDAEERRKREQAEQFARWLRGGANA